MSILLYCPTLPLRLRYISTYLLTDLLGIPVAFTTSTDDFLSAKDIAINYSTSRIRRQEVQLFPAELLFTKEIYEQHLTSNSVNGVPVCYSAPPGYALPFDPFAASFFVLSRYEEYLPYEPDKHGRYSAARSWLARNKALDRPILWQWAQLLKEAINKVYPAFISAWPKRKYQFIPTYDIDIPWAFRYRGWRAWIRSGLELFTLQTSLLRARWQAWLDATTDPYFTFPQLRILHQLSRTRPTIFWLVADRAKHDINPDPRLAAFQSLVISVANWAELGIHPSYQQGQQAAGIYKEKQRLEKIIKTPIKHSRQHFLRFSLPHTYQQLLAAGIEADYSMGYADATGFRAGTTEPFWWYDLENDAVTSLRVYPFAVMDVTLKQYLGLAPKDAEIYLHQMQAYCKREGLSFCTLWHNSSFSAYHGWEEEWWRVYQSLFSTLGAKFNEPLSASQ